MSREPVVAVCTNRSPAAVAEALAALSDQAPAERILVVTSGLAGDAAAAHRATAPGPIEDEPRLGLSIARNRALDWAAAFGAPAIAFVDDDAVVEHGWWRALVARWEAAADDVGVIGGPIRPRWPGTPPAGIPAPLLPARTLLDLGDRDRWLDPSVTTFFGANISFAVEPLRAAGGFD